MDVHFLESENGMQRSIIPYRSRQPVSRSSGASCDQRGDHLHQLHAGEAAVETLVLVGEALVVEAEELEHGGAEGFGMQIVSLISAGTCPVSARCR